MPRSKKRILWVDDDLMFYRSYHDELAEIYRIDIAKSPDAMWGLLKDHPVDHYSGIVLDVLLPFRGMDPEKTNAGLKTGLILLEMLKGSEYSGIPVVIFSIRETKDVDDIGQRYHAQVLRKSEIRILEFIGVVKKEFGV